jgi:hypothetical protein
MASASVEEVVGGVAVGVEAGHAVAPTRAPAAAPAGPMRWNNAKSGFVLRRMAQLVSDGSRPDKVFKDKDVNLVAKQLFEFSGEVVSPTQVYNHLRKWRQKWENVAKLKDLSGALWDTDLSAIMLDVEHYSNHIKVEIISSSLYLGSISSLVYVSEPTLLPLCRTTLKMPSSLTVPLGSTLRWKPSLATLWPLGSML